VGIIAAGELFPQLVDALPLRMRLPMRDVGRMSGGGTVLRAMNPLSPTLLPVLMPDMVNAVGQGAPMSPQTRGHARGHGDSNGPCVAHNDARHRVDDQ